MPTSLFVCTVTHICNLVCPEPASNPFMFSATTKVALHNGNLLSTFQGNLGGIIDTHPASSLSYGSEFRPISQLEALFNDHLSRPKLHNTLLYGSNFNILQERRTKERLAVLIHMHEYGNHSLATSC